jgi:signal transduction histidine kinase
MASRWGEASSRVRGRWAISLTAYLIASPFWILGFLFNEAVTYASWENALGIAVVATLGHLGLGLVFLIAHLTVLRRRAQDPAPLGLVITVWGLAGATRAVVLVVGLTAFGLDDVIPTQQRVLFSALIAIAGFAVAAYALDAIERFSVARAQVLNILLHGEEQLAAHRAAVASMQEALVAKVDKKLKESHDATIDALDQLEESLTSNSQALPALEDLRELSDSTWQRISQDLWDAAPSEPPKIRLRELLELWATSRPFRLLYLVLASAFLFILLYNRVLDPTVGALLVGLWTASALTVGALGNWLLPSLQKYAVPAFLVVVTFLVFSSIPLLVLADSWGQEMENPWRVVSVHALSVFLALSTALPSSVESARERILAGLKRSLDSTTLEKLHVESQLKVLSHKIANRLHGDVRGNFLAAILKLQDQIARGNTRAAALEIQSLRDILQESQDVTPVAADSRVDLEKFVHNWGALVDIALDQPLSTLEDAYVTAVHTIVVDAVNNAVRHGKADWIRIGFSREPGALMVTIQNNGEAKQSGRAGLGTAHLNLYAPDKWSLVRTANGLTQLLVRLESSSLPQESALR